jgi:peptide/nickel transport system substrate-binding protein
MCKKYIETVGDEKARWEPIGSGPYRLVEHKFGEYLKFEASDEHWLIVPEFKYIVVQIVPEESTRIAMLKTGETDIVPISAQSLPDLQKRPEITAKPYGVGYCLFAWFGGRICPADKRYQEGYHLKDPWEDIRVREALRIAIDREAIIKAIYKGAASPMAIAWSLPGWQDLPPIPYDPERAKRLLGEAGYPNGFDVTVVATSGWSPAFEMPKVMEIVAAQLKEIGINTTIKAMDKAQQFALNRAGKTAGMIFPWKDSMKVSFAGRHRVIFSPGGNPVIFCSDEFTPLIEKYEGEIDLTKRAAYLGDVRDYRYKNKLTIPLIVARSVWAWRNDTVGEWPKSDLDKNHLFKYIRHPKPLNTWRLFTP